MSTAVWRDREFTKLFSGQALSQLGTQVTFIALPSAAVLQFHAGPLAVGALAAVQRVPFPILALTVGGLVDRIRRRPLMIAADLGRLVALGVVPLLDLTGHLALWHLFAVALVIGVLSVLFDVAYLAYVPHLASADRLVAANTLLQASESVAYLAGPGLGGVLIQLLGAARALAADALSYLVSVVTLLMIRRPELAPDRSGRRHLLREIGEGVGFVWRDPVLRSLVLCLGAIGIGAQSVQAIDVLFIYTRLHLSPAELGAAFSLAGVGALLGTAVTQYELRRLGVGTTLAVNYAACGGLFLLMPLGLRGAALPLVALMSLLNGVLNTVCEIIQLSLRQARTSARLQGRMNSVFRTVFWGAWPVASLLGGVGGATIGLVPTIVAGSAVTIACSAVIMFTPLRSVRTLTESAA